MQNGQWTYSASASSGWQPGVLAAFIAAEARVAVMSRWTLTALAALMPIAPLAAQDHALHGVDYVTDPRPAPRGEGLMRREVMALHDRARADYGVAPLAWDERLARSAAGYARKLARSGRFEHDPQIGVQPRQGENLWMGTRGGYRYADMIQGMIDERANYVPGVFPNVSRTGRWWEVAHYTQLVWPATTRVGCAVASNRSDDYLVCRYLTAGNVVGTPLR